MNIKNVAVALVTLIASSAAQAQEEPMQWRVEDGGNGHWYQVVATGSGIDWPTARSAAVALNGHLATVTSAAEDSFVASVASAPGAWNSNHGPWLGGFQDRSATDYAEPRGGWRWVSGEEWTWAQWDAPNSDEPNDCYCNCGTEDFLHYKAPNRWNDFNGTNATNCIQPVAFLVEWSADCNGDGIVDYGQCRDGSLPDYNGNNIPDCCESGTPCVVGNYPVQWRVEDGGNGHWYRFVIGQTISWDDARAAAVVRGGYLASVTSLEESDFVVGACSDTAGWIQTSYYWLGPWLGGYQPPNSTEPAGGWTWLSDEPWGWTRWWPGSSEPNNGCSGHEDYLVMCTQSPLSGPSGWWNDSAYPDACGGPSPISYLIEWSADCNNDGIVDIGQIYLQPELYADANSNGIPDSCEVDPCPGDITGGGFVDAIDLSILLAFWGSTGGGEFDADVNNDGIVEGADLSIVLGGWGPCPN